MNLDEALDLPVARRGAPATIRKCLYVLLSDLWRYEQSFDGKRPFGNSDWQWDVYRALFDGGLIEGTVDEYEDFDCDGAKASELMQRLIAHMCSVDPITESR